MSLSNDKIPSSETNDLKLLPDESYSQSTINSSIAISSEFFFGLIEQNLLPVLEMISSGIKVSVDLKASGKNNNNNNNNNSSSSSSSSVSRTTDLSEEEEDESLVAAVDLFPESFIRLTAKNIIFELTKFIDTRKETLNKTNKIVSDNNSNTTKTKKSSSDFKSANNASKQVVVSFQKKLFNSLYLTQDMQLKKNIFFSILFLSARSDDLSR